MALVAAYEVVSHRLRQYALNFANVKTAGALKLKHEMGVEPTIWENPPNPPLKTRIFHYNYKPSIFRYP